MNLSQEQIRFGFWYRNPKENWPPKPTTYLEDHHPSERSNLVDLPKLKHLHLGSSHQVASIEVIGKLNSLITLDLEQLNMISDLSIISELEMLQGLGIDGSMWTPQKIDSIKPLKNLIDLRYLTLTNTRIRDRSFEPILNLTTLVRFLSSWNYPEFEFEKLKQLPHLKFGNIEKSWKEIREIT